MYTHSKDILTVFCLNLIFYFNVKLKFTHRFSTRTQLLIIKSFFLSLSWRNGLSSDGRNLYPLPFHGSVVAVSCVSTAALVINFTGSDTRTLSKAV